MSRPRHMRGLTLIELLVAISIFAILGLMSWRALSTTLDSRERLRQEFGAWQQLGRLFSLVDGDLTQIAVRESVSEASLPALSITTLANGSHRLLFWRLADSSGSRLTGYEFADGKFSLLRWKTDDYSLEPRKEVLLPAVKAVRWSFTDVQANTAWLPTWPPQTERRFELPSGVRLELDIEGIGTVSRIYALR